ncbi:NO-inducible flavohemoprotein [Pseudoalteromonas xiamenensis]
MLSEQQFALIEQSLPLVANVGVGVTEHFYARLFEHNPEVKHYFNLSNQQSGKQPFALFSAIARFATFLGEPEKLDTLKKQIAQKHVALTIKPEHYPIVGTHLIATLQELFPEDFTKDIEAAWTAAYLAIADLLITEETGLYAQNAAAVGGWDGTRQFQITRIEQESEQVKSFYLAPTNGGPIVGFTPGQYLTVQVQPGDQAYRQMRHYSITGIFDGQYRISVKQDGVVSGFLHKASIGALIDLTPPSGDFTLKTSSNPKVFISAGVGITPMVAMLGHLVEMKSSTPCHFLHACQNEAMHSFKEWLNGVSQKTALVDVIHWYEEQSDYATFTGFMNLHDVTNLPIKDGEFYLCGPIGFMKAIYKQLTALGVSQSQIHYELFGPHSDLAA